MNNTLQEPLPIINDNNFSITSFLFYFLYFLIFVFLSFFIISYFYPDSIFKKIYNYFLQDFYTQEKQKSNTTQEKQLPTNTTQEKQLPNDNTTTNTTQEIQLPNNQKISLDDAVDQYMVLQNQTNSELGKINYLPPKQYTNKQGWCLVGNDRGFNSCIKVGRNDYCMSGDIYPTKDICINPTLRL
jgi:hypothetical protein